MDYHRSQEQERRMATRPKKIAIIGGGISGIGCVVGLKEEGHEPICFEATDKYGGTFCYREEAVVGLGSTMPTVVLYNNKEVGAFSNFPPRKEFGTYLRLNEIYQYLTDYYNHNNCERYMRFNKEVIHVKKNEDYKQTGRFSVTVKDKITGNVSTQVFDGVMIATGHSNIPKTVTFTGQEKFKGSIRHAHSLKYVKEFKGKNVLVIGTGCSGLNAADAISSVAKHVYISTRTGVYATSRLGPFGYPMDYVFFRRIFTALLDILPRNVCSWMLERFILDARFDHRLYYIKPKYHMLSKNPAVNDGIMSKLLSGTIVQKGMVKYFTENGVVFDDEETVTEVDDVILATGYTFEFPFLEKGLLEIEDGRINLYKCMYPPQLPHHTLVFIGFINPFGPGVPAGELQIRWAAQMFSGKGKLPAQEIMKKEVNKRHEQNERTYAPSEFNSIRVDGAQYMDDIASEIGAKPSLMKYLFTDFLLFLNLIFGPLLPYNYRLEGPHAWEGARNAIMTSHDRVFFPLTKNNKSKRSFLEIIFELVGSLLPKNIFF